MFDLILLNCMPGSVHINVKIIGFFSIAFDASMEIKFYSTALKRFHLSKVNLFRVG